MKKSTTAERLKYLMTQRNLRQVDIQRAAEPYAAQYNVKMNRSDISQYVSGKVEPSQDKLTILGLALGVDPVWLMGVDVPMTSELPADESELMQLYHSVTPEGQAYILSTARMVAGNPAMTISPTSENEVIVCPISEKNSVKSEKKKS